VPQLLAPAPTPQEIQHGFANPEIRIIPNSEGENEYWVSLFFSLKITLYSLTNRTFTDIWIRRLLLHRLAQRNELLDLNGSTKKWTNLTEQLLMWPWGDWARHLLLLLT
jgi:hypothetical protein